jgi:hypothetical protein
MFAEDVDALKENTAKPSDSLHYHVRTELVIARKGNAMNREETFEIMKNGGYVTHPKLVDAGIGPLSLVGDVVYVNDNEPIAREWKLRLDSDVSNDSWLKYDASRDDKSARVKRLIALSKQYLQNGDSEGAMAYLSQASKLNHEILVSAKEEINRLFLEKEQK